MKKAKKLSMTIASLALFIIGMVHVSLPVYALEVQKSQEKISKSLVEDSQKENKVQKELKQMPDLTTLEETASLDLRDGLFSFLDPVEGIYILSVEEKNNPDSVKYFELEFPKGSHEIYLDIQIDDGGESYFLCEEVQIENEDSGDLQIAKTEEPRNKIKGEITYLTKGNRSKKDQISTLTLYSTTKQEKDETELLDINPTTTPLKIDQDKLDQDNLQKNEESVTQKQDIDEDQKITQETSIVKEKINLDRTPFVREIITSSSAEEEVIADQLAVENEGLETIEQVKTVKAALNTNNTHATGSLKVSVVDQEGNLLENALIAIYSTDAKSYILRNAEEYQNTSDKGIVYFSDLDSGEYILKEMTAPTGYAINKEEYQVQIVNGKESEVTISHVLEKDAAGVTSENQAKEDKPTDKDKTQPDTTETKNTVTANTQQPETQATVGSSSNQTNKSSTTTGAPTPQKPNNTTSQTSAGSGTEGTTTKQSTTIPVTSNASPQTGDKIDDLQKSLQLNLAMVSVFFIAFAAVFVWYKRKKNNAY